MTARRILRLVLCAFFVFAGLNHFVSPEVYRPIMPPFLPFPDALIFVSGALEIALGLLLVFPRTRKLAAIGLVLLLIAVFPANIYMALSGQRFEIFPPWFVWARLPLQLVLIGWVLHASKHDVHPVRNHV